MLLTIIQAQSQADPAAVKLLVAVLSGITGSFVTLIANHFYSRWKDKKEKRERIFKTLMSTRGFRTSLAHVEALCSIEVEWSGKNDGKVRSAWRAYNYHLNQAVTDDINHPDNVAWRNKVEELFADLVVALGESIGKPQDKTEVKRGAYGPRSWGDAEWEWTLVRKALVNVFNQGKAAAVPVLILYDDMIEKQIAVLGGQQKPGETKAAANAE